MRVRGCLRKRRTAEPATPGRATPRRRKGRKGRREALASEQFRWCTLSECERQREIDERRYNEIRARGAAPTCAGANAICAAWVYSSVHKRRGGVRISMTHTERCRTSGRPRAQRGGDDGAVRVRELDVLSEVRRCGVSVKLITHQSIHPSPPRDTSRLESDAHDLHRSPPITEHRPHGKEVVRALACAQDGPLPAHAQKWGARRRSPALPLSINQCKPRAALGLAPRVRDVTVRNRFDSESPPLQRKTTTGGSRERRERRTARGSRRPHERRPRSGVFSTNVTVHNVTYKRPRAQCHHIHIYPSPVAGHCTLNALITRWGGRSDKARSERAVTIRRTPTAESRAVTEYFMNIAPSRCTLLAIGLAGRAPVVTFPRFDRTAHCDVSVIDVWCYGRYLVRGKRPEDFPSASLIFSTTPKDKDEMVHFVGIPKTEWITSSKVTHTSMYFNEFITNISQYLRDAPTRLGAEAPARAAGARPEPQHSGTYLSTIRALHPGGVWCPIIEFAVQSVNPKRADPKSRRPLDRKIGEHDPNTIKDDRPIGWPHEERPFIYSAVRALQGWYCALQLTRYFNRRVTDRG
ncbi:hypothetical protein EVAR_24142_1 [Eumeta japonica]|uniref:Uncharacterized protein n=1 Tax=Eumeta variegata TaxID=151549 RepID=A0A4C1YSW5_EUMVA|nr:hypothetical protein EVAR_24142_1 [Eumeta japonica]